VAAAKALIVILPDLILPYRVNQTLTEYGVDTLNAALDKQHFKTYPYNILYQYNSRGFRDAEWPEDNDLADAIWCIGDSFTTGMGNYYEHIWTQQLQSKTQHRTINISLDGASNDWIVEQTNKIIQKVQPKNLVIMWSFFHRRQIDNTSSIEEKQFWDGRSTHAADFDHFYKLCTGIASSTTNLIHLLIPNAFYYCGTDVNIEWDKVKGPDWPSTVPNDINSLPEYIIKELMQFDCYDKLQSVQKYAALPKEIKNYTGEVKLLDYARDGLHFGKETSDKLVDLILPLLR
jgi:hypothetical protein